MMKRTDYTQLVSIGLAMMIRLVINRTRRHHRLTSRLDKSKCGMETLPEKLD